MPIPSVSVLKRRTDDGKNGEYKNAIQKETRIALTLSLDGTGSADIDTGIGFFDHMLDGFARHGFFDLSVKVDGDLFVDGHHTVEDTGIVLGQAIAEAVGDKKRNQTLRIFSAADG